MSGRYNILGHIAKGGMASVYLGRMSGSAGFSRLVAIKRLHSELAAEAEFVAMLVDEARLAAQIRHTNVIDTLDLVVSDGAFSLVLEYVEGDSLSALVRSAKKAGEKVPRDIALAIMHGVLKGLDAAHDARGVDGHPLGVVHRDVSPQNVLVGVDGIPRVIDFGVAKAVGKLEATKPGEVRGKFSYMAPEQLLGKPVTRQVDVYASGVMLWELLTGERLFKAEDQRAVCAAVLRGDIKRPSDVNPDVPKDLDDVVLRATSQDLGQRHLTARELLVDLEKHPRASDEEVGAWVRRLTVEKRAQRQRIIEGDSSSSDIHSIDDIMKELGGAPIATPRSVSSASPIEIAAPAKTKSKSKASVPLVIGLGAFCVFAVVALAVASQRKTTAAPAPPDPPPSTASTPTSSPTPAPAPTAPAASIVVSSVIVETAAPPSPAPPPPPKVKRKTAPATAPAKDPASFQ